MKQKRWPNSLLQATLLTLMAGTSLTAQANECASISDNMKRLACFDSLFPGQPVTAEKPGSNAADIGRAVGQQQERTNGDLVRNFRGVVQ